MYGKTACGIVWCRVFFGVLCVGLICDLKVVVINTLRQKHFSEDNWVRKDFFFCIHCIMYEGCLVSSRNVL